MKWLKTTLLLLLVLCMLVTTSGCGLVEMLTSIYTVMYDEPQPTTDPIRKAYKQDPASFVVFNRSSGITEVLVPISDILQYQSQFSDCNSTWFRDQMTTEEDLTIYNSYLYALENRFIGFELYVEDNDKDFSYIREALSLDSPFLEQNYSSYEFTHKWPTNYIGERIYCSMEQFTDSRWEMKMEALDKCRQIIENIPQEHTTQLSKMEYLYDYVCRHVEYVEYENMNDESYFYDAVCKGQTLCDGYSNMLSLLFNLIGVECCEAMGYDNEDEAGHTWVVAKLDGEYYNFDPTYEDTKKEPYEPWGYFGFSDDFLGVKISDHEQIRPKCTDTSRDFPYADVIVENLKDKKEIKKIVSITEKSAKKGDYSTWVAVRSAVDDKTFDRFSDKYFKYGKKAKRIEYSGYLKRNSALIEVTIKLK